MKVVRGSAIDFEPASHEDPDDPGVLKKVLLTSDDLLAGMIPMVNWASLPAGKSFAAHYHEDMQEVFVIVNGNGTFAVDNDSVVVGRQDVVVVPVGAVHRLENTGNVPLEYVVFGVSGEGKGKTVVVE